MGPFMVNLHPQTGANILVAYLVHGHAREAEKSSDDELVVHCMEMLKATLPEEALVPDANLVEAKVTRWAADEFSMGSYSYLPPGATGEDRKSLSHPCGPIFFAG